ncbi:MAG: hypothetical protein U0996_03070 [Planctomycetaceae bacterium]
MAVLTMNHSKSEEIEKKAAEERYFASRESHEIHCRSRLKDAGNCSKMWPRWSGK